ncbi:MAG: Holliday junction resolvase RuvX [Bacteriovoracaceae bacterium]
MTNEPLKTQLLSIEKYEGMSFLAIDFGQKKAGTASFRLGFDPYPTPLETCFYKSPKDLFQFLKSHIDNENIEVIIIGLPKHKDGSDSKITSQVRKFENELKAKHPECEFFFQDEYLSSFEAGDRIKAMGEGHSRSKEPGYLDSVAACVILEDFLAQNFKEMPKK